MNSRVRGNLAVRVWVLLILATAFVAPARADQPSAYGPELEGFEYPFTPERFSFPSQGQTVSMTFMDVAPNKPNKSRSGVTRGQSRFPALTRVWPTFFLMIANTYR